MAVRPRQYSLPLLFVVMTAVCVYLALSQAPQGLRMFLGAAGVIAAFVAIWAITFWQVSK